MIGKLEARHGPLMFHQSGGCCGGSAPMCYPRGRIPHRQRRPQARRDRRRAVLHGRGPVRVLVSRSPPGSYMNSSTLPAILSPPAAQAVARRPGWPRCAVPPGLKALPVQPSHEIQVRSREYPRTRAERFRSRKCADGVAPGPRSSPRFAILVRIQLLAVRAKANPAPAPSMQVRGEIPFGGEIARMG